MPEFKIEWTRKDIETVEATYICTATVEANTIEDAILEVAANGWAPDELEQVDCSLTEWSEGEIGDASYITGPDEHYYYTSDDKFYRSGTDWRGLVSKGVMPDGTPSPEPWQVVTTLPAVDYAVLESQGYVLTDEIVEITRRS